MDDIYYILSVIYFLFFLMSFKTEIQAMHPLKGMLRDNKNIKHLKNTKLYSIEFLKTEMMSKIPQTEIENMSRRELPRHFCFRSRNCTAPYKQGRIPECGTPLDAKQSYHHPRFQPEFLKILRRSILKIL